MSEQGWRDFLAADGVDDWVVLHGGAAAVFEVDSLAEAVALAGAVAAVVAEEPAVLMTVGASQLSVRLTRDVWDLEGRHIDLARAISLIARDHGAQANRAAVQEIQLAIAARPAEIDLGFWQAVLGYSPKAEDNAVDPLGHGSTVWMQDLDPAKQLRHAMHVDVSLAREEAETRVAAAVAAGGWVVVDAEGPRSWILSDRAGNRVCIAC